MRRTVLAFILLVPLAAFCETPTINPENVLQAGLIPPIAARGLPQVRRPLAERMRELRVPGLSLAVVHNYQIQWAKAYGLADVAAGRPVTNETLFQAASISKCFSAVAALELVEQGKLRLDEDVNSKLKSWKVPEDRYTAPSKVTLRRLLSHGAGLNVSGFPGYAPGSSIPTLVDVLEGRKPANNPAVRVEYYPGMEYVYSGGGFEIVQLLLTEVTRTEFARWLQTGTLDRLRLKRSTFQQPLPAPYAPYAATGYKGDGSAMPGRYFIYPELAAAGLWTTPSDIAQFCLELLKARRGLSKRLLSEAMAREMFSLQMKPSGLGFQLREGASQWFLHTGANAGFQALLLFNFDGDGLVAMTNSDSGLVLIREIVATLASAYGWVDFYPEQRPVVWVDANRLQRYAGVYEARKVGRMFVEARGDHLEVGSESRPAVSFFPESAEVFFPETPGFKVHFRRDWLGRMMLVTGPVRASRLYGSPFAFGRNEPATAKNGRNVP